MPLLPAHTSRLKASMGTYVLTLHGQQIFHQVGQFIGNQVADVLQAWQANRVIHQHRYKPYLGGLST